METNMNLSFAGCGFLAIYHAGVAAAIKEYAPQLQQNKMSAASAGAIAAASLMCNVDVSDATSTFLKIVKEARSRALGALHPSFNLIEEVSKSLDKTLPDNAHEICSERLQISLTAENGHKNVIVSKFDSKAELIQAICCSCFIPFYCGRVFPYFRGERYFDGGWSDNQPIMDVDTVTVSPFSGESDICPPDLDSASLFGFVFAGTSIRFTSENLYRLTVCLMPPSMEVCSRICRQGFEDALRFCIKNGLTSDARCLTILSSANICPVKCPPLTRSRNASEVFKSSSNNNVNKADHASISQALCLSSRVSAQIALLFPDVLRKVIEEADVDNTLLGYFYSFRMIRWIRNATVPFTLPFEIFYVFCKNITKWIEQSEATNYWFAEKLRLVVNFLMKEIERQRAMYSARLTCQLAITEVDITSFSAGKAYLDDDFLLNIKPSAEAEKELELLRKRDSQIFNRRLLRDQAKATTSSTQPKELGESSLSVDAASGYAKDHDPVLSYSYLNERDEMRVCEIFDVDRSKMLERVDAYAAESPAIADSEKCKFQIEEFDMSRSTTMDEPDVDNNILIRKRSISLGKASDIGNDGKNLTDSLINLCNEDN